MKTCLIKQVTWNEDKHKNVNPSVKLHELNLNSQELLLLNLYLDNSIVLPSIFEVEDK